MRASTMTFHEYYGELPTYLLRAVRKYNVSPSDYDALMEAYTRDYNAMHDAIVRYSPNGSFQVWTWGRTEAIYG